MKIILVIFTFILFSNINLVNARTVDTILSIGSLKVCALSERMPFSSKSGKLKGACLDVLEHEETSFENLSKEGIVNDMQYLMDSKRIILSPHIAGWTAESNIKIAEVLLKKILQN